MINSPLKVSSTELFFYIKAKLTVKKMYSSTNCDKNRGSCVNILFLNQDKERFCYLPKGLSFPIMVTPPPHPSSPAATGLFAAFIDWLPFIICYMNRVMNDTSFVSGSFQLSITCLRSVRIFGIDNLCFRLSSESHFTMGIQHDFFIHQVMDIYL